jgi:hypothetical protein
MQQSTIITLAQRLISNYNDLLAATVNMEDVDRVYYARRIQEGIDRAEEMIAREKCDAGPSERNVGNNSVLIY